MFENYLYFRCDHVKGCVNSSGAVNNSTDTISEGNKCKP